MNLGAIEKREREFIGNYYALRGFAFVAVDFRLAPQNSYPAQVEESFCAPAWIHAHAEDFPALEVNGILQDYWGAPLEEITQKRLAEM